MNSRRQWRLVIGTAFSLMLLVGACGRPGEEDDVDDPGITPGATDRTPLNKELELPFDGEVPDLVMGKDGTVHIMYRVTQGQTARLFYSRKSPVDNVWTTPIQVPGSGNAAYRWFAWPDISVGDDGRVHFVWAPEPTGNNGMFYSSCLACDGTDWRGRADGNQFTKLCDDLVEFMEICTATNKTVHIIATQLNRFNGQVREQDDQMVHYHSLNNGENWEKNYYITKPQAYEDLNMKCIGDDVHLMMRFKDAVYARYVADGTGGRSWVITGRMPHAGPSLSEVSFFNDKNGVLTGYVYASWEYRDPLGVYYTNLQSGTTVLSPIVSHTLRPNGVMGGENSRGQRAALWADRDGYFHSSDFDGTAWSPVKPFTEKLTPLNATNGLSRAAIYAYSAGHGWSGKILWPVTAIGEYNGAFHVVFRSPRENDERGTTKSGRWHYIKYQPFEPTTDHALGGAP